MWWKNKTNQVPDLNTLLIFSGGTVIFIGAITLFGWITGISSLVNNRPYYIPMSPANSVFFIVYGLILVSFTRYHLGKRYRGIIILIIVLFSLYGMLQFLGHLVKSDLNFDYTLFPVTERLGNFPLRHMSPYSGLLFFISGIAILLKLIFRNRTIVTNITGAIGIIVAFAGFVAGLGYMFGTPFLYSGKVIPLAIKSAISFLFLGSGLLLIAGEKTFFLRRFTGPTSSARLLRTMIPLIIALFMLEGVMDVIFTHYYKINEALLLALQTIFSVIIGIIVIVNITKGIFQSANKAEEDRLKAIEELKKVNAQHSLILENNIMGICMICNNVFQWNNTRFSEIFQLPEKNLRGISTQLIFKSDKISENWKRWLSDLKENKITDKVLQLTRDSGDQFWCRFIGTPLEPFNSDEGSIWMVEDITERYLLRTKMRLLSHTIENLSESISITDTKDQIIFVNKAFEKTYGFNHDELLGKNISVISSVENDQELVGSILPSTINGGWQGEIMNRRKDGTVFPVYLATSKVLDDDGKIAALVGVAIDITARRQSEKQLEKYAEELKASNDAKDKLFSIISHDLRSPFNSILGFFNLLSEQYDDISEDERKSFIHELKKSSENAFMLLENLLTWSRAQTGGIKVTAICFDLAGVVDQQFEVLKNAADSKKINLSNQISDGTVVFADQDMVKTILLNLINNAIKFTRSEGSIMIYAVKNDKEFQITVEDNGVGIPKSVLDNMFRIDKSHSTLGTSNEKGTGLGLLICKEFAERNGGKIWVESEPGKGSKFIFTLPLYPDIEK
jgi:PAS domain S-box-containing protein